MITRVEHHYFFHGNSAIEQKLDCILKLLKKQGETIMADLTKLEADVATETTVTQSAVTLINGLAAQVTAAGTDPVKLKAVTDQMEANAAALAAAVTANTPAPPAAGAGSGSGSAA